MAASQSQSPEIHRLQSDPSDWIYLSEGKVNAVFAYSSNGCGVTDYQGCILRIAKCDFMKAISQLEHNEISKLDAAATVETDIDEVDCHSDCREAVQSIDFISRLLRPALGEQYVDVPMLTCLSAKFLQKLHNLQRGNIPKSRLEKEWSKYESHLPRHTVEAKTFLATIHRNYTLFDYSSPVPLFLATRKTPRCSICVEIKPKAGYLSRSPLIKKEHRAKLYHHRYGIMQNLMVSGHVVKGWGGILLEPSSYSPLDLFSGNYRRIECALLALFRHPQNNLRLFYNGVLVLSNERTPSDKDLSHIITTMLSDDGTEMMQDRSHLQQSEALSRDVFVQKMVLILSQIFLKEPLLCSLLSLQQNCDLIDADGAVEVYARLVELCDGSYEEAEELIDFYSVVDEGEERSKEADSTYSVSKPECSALDALCSELNNNIMQHEPKTTISDLNLDESYARSIESVKNLSRESCVWLLQQWLLSLCACDVSLMVCFENCVSPSRAPLHNFSSNSQEVTKAGSLLTSDQDGTLRNFFYSLKVADTDLKPSKKLRTRHHKERMFRHF